MYEFCIPTTGTKVPSGPEWLHEIKFDGYRMIVHRDRDRVRLITKGGHDWTSRFPRTGTRDPATCRVRAVNPYNYAICCSLT
jgi:ATP-dependent DNA ligase